jgi:bifunctional non-homologous end joining protein LigD
MALEEYESKRDFRQTPEPQARPGKPHRRPIFVVQEHHASKLHYDFRLEADGVLKSWAVPKSPSMDPAQKRLAVRVEDHPLAYAGFEGTIPEGQYGAGTVTVWDRGTYDNLADEPVARTVAEGIEAGKLEFALHGERLRGRFALVRMRGRGKDNWLLIKAKDDQARPEPDTQPSRKVAAPRRPVAAKAPSRRTVRPPAEAVNFTNLDKVMFPDEGITKGDVVEFYRRIAPRLLPFLRDRPVTLERLPEGVGEGVPHFWQKDTPASYPDWIARAELPAGEGKTVRYVLVNDVETLLYLVNQGALTFHVWFSRLADLDRPDFVLFDLDVGQATFADAVAVAREVRAVLAGEGHEAYVKTSGKTGLHVLAPWSGGGYDEARAWAEGIARRVVDASGDRATTERSKSKRGGRLYLDVMQNARGRHAVPPYVLRAVPAATVSMPLDWREVTEALDPARFTLRTAFRRLDRQKHDPLAGLARQFDRSGKK